MCQITKSVICETRNSNMAYERLTLVNTQQIVSGSSKPFLFTDVIRPNILYQVAMLRQYCWAHVLHDSFSGQGSDITANNLAVVMYRKRRNPPANTEQNRLQCPKDQVRLRKEWQTECVLIAKIFPFHMFLNIFFIIHSWIFNFFYIIFYIYIIIYNLFFYHSYSFLSLMHRFITLIFYVIIYNNQYILIHSFIL